MIVIINGQEKTFTAPLNLYDCLAQEGVVEMLVAVAHNRNFVPRGDYLTTFLKDGDELEILAPMQGG